MSEPKGEIKVTGTIQRNPTNKHAVFVRVLIEDEEGKKFYFDASCFRFDLSKTE